MSKEDLIIAKSLSEDITFALLSHVFVIYIYNYFIIRHKICVAVSDCRSIYEMRQHQINRNRPAIKMRLSSDSRSLSLFDVTAQADFVSLAVFALGQCDSQSSTSVRQTLAYNKAVFHKS